MNILKLLISARCLLILAIAVPGLSQNNAYAQRVGEAQLSSFDLHGIEHIMLGRQLDESMRKRCVDGVGSYFDVVPGKGYESYTTCNVSTSLGTYFLTLNSRNEPMKIEMRFESDLDISALFRELYLLKDDVGAGLYRGNRGASRYVYRSDAREPSIHYVSMFIETI